MPSIFIDQIIRSNRRTLCLHITAQAKLIVRSPQLCLESEINAFVLQKQNWIEHHQLRLLKTVSLRSDFQWPKNLNRKLWLNRYRYVAFTIISSRCKHIASLHQLNFSKINISNARRRWGSCSFHGNLNFNWRLILAPLFVLDYLIVHELAHLKVKNHSHIFWKMVKEMDPTYLTAEHWLKHNGYLLDI